MVLLVFFLQERVAIEADHLVGDASTAEEIADGLRHEQDDLRKERRRRISCSFVAFEGQPHHGRQNVGQSTRQFEHDDHNGDGNPSDSAKRCCGSEESVRARCDARLVWHAHGEPGRRRMRSAARSATRTPPESGRRSLRMDRLDKNADHPAKCRSDRHRWYKDASRDLAAVRDDDQPDPHNCSEQQ